MANISGSRSMTRRMVVLCMWALIAPVAAHGQAGTPTTLEDVRTRYLQDIGAVHRKYLALAEAIPESLYTWRPSPSVRSIAEVLTLVVAENYGLFNGGGMFGMPLATGFDGSAEQLQRFLAQTDKATIVDHLRRSTEYLATGVRALPVTSLGSLPLFGRTWNALDAFWLFAGDQHEHLGQLIAYARSVGVVPPWSRAGARP